MLLLAGCGGREPGREVVRIGHFPNVTHVHGLVAHALSRRGEGVFEKHLGPGVRVEWYVFNAGPSAMESLLAGSLDATYVGPNPAINAHLRTGGDDVRVLAGATDGGAALVVREAAGIATPADFRGRRIATPQLGNTQDVACRAWLRAQGFAVSQTGGDVAVVPTANPDQLALFQSGELDAAWTVEPWVTRLELEGGGRVMLAEDDAVTTVLAASAAVVERQPDVAARLTAAHRELTAWIRSHPDETRDLVCAELEAETGHRWPEELVERCLARLRPTDDVDLAALQSFVDKARAAGLLRGDADLSRLLVRP